MSISPLAPFPSANIRKHIVPEEWRNCLETWLVLTQRYLRLPPPAFAGQVVNDSSLIRFLTSYVAHVSHESHDQSVETRNLRKTSFLLIHRAFEEVKSISRMLLEWNFLSRLCILYAKVRRLKDVLPAIWRQYELSESASVQKSKVVLTAMLENAHMEPLAAHQLAPYMAMSRTCFLYAQFLMLGSDLLDSLVSAYGRVTSPSLQKHLVALSYVCIESLLNEQEMQTSSLLDHLYSLKSTKLARALVEDTPFLSKFQRHTLDHEKGSGRAKPLLEAFSKYDIRFKSSDPLRRRINKGKHKSVGGYERGASRDMHVHKLSLVTQVQDLFPDLGSGFVIKLLDEYHDDTEAITAHLLDSNLPKHLQQADHAEIIDLSSAAYADHEHEPAPHIIPHSTPPLPPTRRNIFDNDDFDNLAIDASTLHFGSKNPDLTADQLLSSERPSTHKAAILSALAAFDSDDDERDDTYDAEDVGGTVDNTLGDDDVDTKGDKNDEVLLHVYRQTPELFQRDWDTRRGQPRQKLKQGTGMTDEAIEGWAIMLSRDPNRLRRLEREHKMGGGLQQSVQESTAWRADSELGNGDASEAGGSRGGDRGRGGRWASQRTQGGRGRGAVAGPASEKDTQVARQRKDANKGSRANHNRRDQRARKMARGGFAG